MKSLQQHPEVDEFIANSQHALANCLQPMRELIHSAEKGLTEQIKWKCPSFCVDSDDRITYNLSKKDQLLVIFHTGAKGKGKTPDKGKFTSFTFLEWLAPDRACIKIMTPDVIKKETKQIKELIRLWLQETRG